MTMREVQISRKYILREDGNIIDIKSNTIKELPKNRRCYRIALKGKEYSLHQLVMKYFGSPKPEGNYVIVHINGDNYDNHITNLKWISYSESKGYSAPVGYRSCDFADKKEYRKACSKLHRERHGIEDNEKRRDRYQNDENYRIKEIEKARDYQYRNYNKCVLRQKRWIENNPDKHKAKVKRTKLKNYDKHKKQSNIWHQAHPIQQCITQQKYYNNHKDEINARRRENYARKKARGTSSEPFIIVMSSKISRS